MAEKRFLQHGSAAIYIETATETGGGDTAMGPKFIRVLQELSIEIGKGISDMDDNERPAEVHMHFGLGVSEDGQFVVTRGESNANFIVSFKWGGAQSVNSPIPIQQ